jgi:hypothetical protein
MGEMGNTHISVAKAEEKGPPGRPIRRLEDNIKMDLKQGVMVVDWIHLAQDRHQCLEHSE